METQLLKAVRKYRVNHVLQLLREGANVNFKGDAVRIASFFLLCLNFVGKHAFCLFHTKLLILNVISFFGV